MEVLIMGVKLIVLSWSLAQQLLLPAIDSLFLIMFYRFSLLE